LSSLKEVVFAAGRGESIFLAELIYLKFAGNQIAQGPDDVKLK